ncbi:MAG: hypothetical protein JWM91_3012 [Rhodospirillales bacterium]|nr:hypothetical protein [Rhodospirillales bacterium]
MRPAVVVQAVILSLLNLRYSRENALYAALNFGPKWDISVKPQPYAMSLTVGELGTDFPAVPRKALLVHADVHLPSKRWFSFRLKTPVRR